jgi:hypothetical protein
MRRKFEQAQAQLTSRAAILLQIGAAHFLNTNAWPEIGCFKFQLDKICVDFDPKEDKPFDDAVIAATIEELDNKIAQVKAEAQQALAFIEAWGA